MADSYINNNSNPLSVGSTQGSGQSFNILKNYRDSSGINVPTGINNLVTWFKTYSQGSTLAAPPYRFSQFRNAIVFRIVIDQFSECSSRGNYHDQNDGILRMSVFGGSGGNFIINGPTSTQTIGNGGQASWTNLAGTYGSTGGELRGDYTNCTITDQNTGLGITLPLIRCYENSYGTSFVNYESVNRTEGNTFWNRN